VHVQDVEVPPEVLGYAPAEENLFVDEESGSLRFNVTVGDPDGTTPQVHWERNGSKVGEGEVYIFPLDYHTAGVYNISAVVRDDCYTVYQSWCVHVQDVNRAPELHAFTPAEAVVELAEGASLEFSVTASDPDGDILCYAWLLDGKLCAEAVAQSRFSYVPDYESAGLHTLEVQISDGKASVSHSWSVRVNETNRAPVLLAVTPEATSLLLDEGSRHAVRAAGKRPGQG
jgi:hypothetical protein